MYRKLCMIEGKRQLHARWFSPPNSAERRDYLLCEFCGHKTDWVEPPPAVVVKPMVPPQPAAAPEIGLVDTILDSPYLVPGGVAAVLVLGALAFLGMRRKKKPQHSDSSILSDSSMQVNSLFGSTGGQSVDTNNSVFNSNFAPSASQLDTNEVDPVAEADVYIAYGRDAQAEEILKEALRTHPERLPVRLKLLEIYAARKDTRAFEGQATELYGLTKGAGDEWAQGAALGLAIDPANPLYAGAAASAAAARNDEQEMLSEELEQSIIGNMPDEPVSLSKDATALPAAAEDHTLDFDLGGLAFDTDKPAPTLPAESGPSTRPMMDFSTPTVVPVPVAPVALDKKDEAFDMAFDMNFDTPAATPPAAPAAEHAQALDDISHDLSAEFASSNSKDKADDLGDLSAAFDIPSVPQPVAKPADNSLDFGDMSFDLPAAAAPAASTPVASADADDFFAMPDIPDARSTPAPAAAQFDMSSIDLDLPVTPAASDVPEFAMESVGEGEMSAQHMEMETKLDLAIAYQEIGDKEGARELLDEVIKGGSNEQVGKANDMRAKLA